MVRWLTGWRTRRQLVTTSRKKGTKKQAASVVLIFGESINDTRALASLIRALCPSLKGRIRPRPHPIALQRSASQLKVEAWIHKLHGAVLAHYEPVMCVFVHRDTDGPDPRGTLAQRTQSQLQSAGIAGVHAVVPVEEIEAWWLLFPNATEAVRKSWSGTLSRRIGDVDAISDPKEGLASRTRRKDSKRAYSEADSPQVAEKVAEAIQAGVRPMGRSASYRRFEQSVATCCRRARAA